MANYRTRTVCIISMLFLLQIHQNRKSITEIGITAGTVCVRTIYVVFIANTPKPIYSFAEKYNRNM